MFSTIIPQISLLTLLLSSTVPVSSTVTPSYAFTRMTNNIGGATNPSQVPNVQLGAVIASPSTASPDYFYSWVRDSSMTMKVYIDQLSKGKFGTSRSIVENWINAETVHQKNAAASQSGSSLGEPKFNVDGSLFTGPWGRPQNDGPAIRATALMQFARNIGLSDPIVAQKLYKSDLSQMSLIKSDLEFVAHHWQDSSFDLWEEKQATHFFTLAVQHRALVEGAAFATDMNDSGAATYYSQQASSIATKLDSFWSSSDNFIHAYQGVNDRKGLDCAVPLASLHGYPSKSASNYSPASDRVLATHKQFVDSFRSLYSINNGAKAPNAVGVGRYQEDVYDGVGTSKGNPWFLCTTAVAEVLYDALNTYSSNKELSVTNVSLDFFKQFSHSVTVGDYSSSSTQYSTLTKGIKSMADGFMSIVQTHAYQNGSLSEEFNRDNGFSTGARDLTWSYAAFISADAAASGNPVF